MLRDRPEARALCASPCSGDRANDLVAARICAAVRRCEVRAPSDELGLIVERAPSIGQPTVIAP